MPSSASRESEQIDESPRDDGAVRVASFEELYRSHVGRVYALCLRLTADPPHAEQLTQDVFVRAWEKLSQLRGDAAFAAWLRRLTVTIVLDERRACARREARVLTFEDDALDIASGVVRRDDDGIDLERAIAGLPEGARTVFVLHDIEGYGHEEIAAMCGVAEGTSKAQLHRARALLREVLG